MTSTKDKLNILEIAEKNLERTIHWVSIIDSKALFMLTLILAIISYIFTKFDTFINLLFYLSNNNEITLLVAIFLLMAVQMIGLIISAIYLILIIYPKRKPYTQEQESLFFFQTISNMTMINFNRKFTLLKTEKAIEGINDQTYNNAIVVKKKFDQLAISIRWFSFSLVVFFFYMVTQAVLTNIYLLGG